MWGNILKMRSARWRDAERRTLARAAAADDPLDRPAHGGLAQTELSERDSGEARVGAQRKQQVLGP